MFNRLPNTENGLRNSSNLATMVVVLIFAFTELGVLISFILMKITVSVELCMHVLSHLFHNQVPTLIM